MQGVKVTSISKGNIALTKIRYPANKEQQKIASMIALLDDRIKKQQQLIDSLKLYKRGAFLELYRKSQKSKYTFSDIYQRNWRTKENAVTEQTHRRRPCIACEKGCRSCGGLCRV